MSEQLEQLKTLLASFTSPEDRAIASQACKDFLNKVRIQSMTPDQAGQALYEATMVRDRKELTALAEYCDVPIVREGAKNLAGQLAAKAAPANQWPTL